MLKLIDNCSSFTQVASPSEGAEWKYVISWKYLFFVLRSSRSYLSSGVDRSKYVDLIFSTNLLMLSLITCTPAWFTNYFRYTFSACHLVEYRKILCFLICTGNMLSRAYFLWFDKCLMHSCDWKRMKCSKLQNKRKVCNKCSDIHLRYANCSI